MAYLFSRSNKFLNSPLQWSLCRQRYGVSVYHHTRPSLLTRIRKDKHENVYVRKQPFSLRQNLYNKYSESLKKDGESKDAFKDQNKELVKVLENRLQQLADVKLKVLNLRRHVENYSNLGERKPEIHDSILKHETSHHTIWREGTPGRYEQNKTFQHGLHSLKFQMVGLKPKHAGQIDYKIAQPKVKQKLQKNKTKEGLSVKQKTKVKREIKSSKLKGKVKALEENKPSQKKQIGVVNKHASNVRPSIKTGVTALSDKNIQNSLDKNLQKQLSKDRHPSSFSPADAEIDALLASTPNLEHDHGNDYQELFQNDTMIPDQKFDKHQSAFSPADAEIDALLASTPNLEHDHGIDYQELFQNDTMITDQKFHKFKQKRLKERKEDGGKTYTEQFIHFDLEKESEIISTIEQNNIAQCKMEDAVPKFDKSEIGNEIASLVESYEFLGKDIQGRIGQYITYLKKSKQEDLSIAPFWNPQELDSMQSIQKAALVVRFMFGAEAKKWKKLADMEKRKQEDLFNKEIKAFVEGCVHANLLKRAHAVVRGVHLNTKSSRKKQWLHRQANKITDISVYNILLQAWAQQGNLKMVQMLVQQAKDTGVEPNLLTHVSILACLGKQKKPSKDAIRNVIQAIRLSDFQLENVLNECKFNAGEWPDILRVIQMVKPDFEVGTHNNLPLYSNRLLEELNEDISSPRRESTNPFYGSLDREAQVQRLEKQVYLEKNETVEVKSIMAPPEVTDSIRYARKKLEESKTSWGKMVKRSLVRNLNFQHTLSKGDHVMNLIPYLKLFPIDTYVDFLLQEIEMLAVEMETHSPNIGYLYLKMGERLYHKYLVSKKIKNKELDKTTSVYESYLDYYNKETHSYRNQRECWLDVLQKENDGTSIDNISTPWPNTTLRALGKYLYGIILVDVKMNVNILKDATRMEIPAFYTIYKPGTEKNEEVIRPHPALVKLYHESQLENLTFHSTDMPMLVPPLPWTSPTSGGSLLATTTLIKHASFFPEQMKLIYEQDPNKLLGVYDSLNAVSACPWKINQDVLDVVMQLFKSGGNTDLDIPPPASSCQNVIKRVIGVLSDKERYEMAMERQKLQKKKQEMHGLWMTELYRLSIANKFRDEVFWFPHNLDFRGRVYAIPPHFNHLGNDMARSILKFGIGKPLGEEGLNWLKIHLINLTGFKKRSPNRERLLFANELMPDILDSADNPLTGKLWWQTSDEPWQTLACCIEIAKASRSPDPAKYICNVPVHQDGSCNGLQHYAALGRDQAGARSVNLHPFDVPSDVYSDVVELVEKERERDAANGNDIAILLEGYVRRKVIKQTIMTSVYGVTRYGAKLQIIGQLEDIPDFPADKTGVAAAYLTQKTFHSLRKMFSAAKEIQDWFTTSAGLISTLSLKPVQWVTPLGLPVIQPYFRYSKQKVLGPKKNYYKKFTAEIPNTMKQMNAFPPNFIHSLDSTHMMLTSIHCLRAGITFVSVHDCYWTHACDVSTMNKICRKQFVDLHSEPILEDLAMYHMEKYGAKEGEVKSGEIVVHPHVRKFLNHVLIRQPPRGAFNLDQVLDSTYFFS